MSQAHRHQGSDPGAHRHMAWKSSSVCTWWGVAPRQRSAASGGVPGKADTPHLKTAPDLSLSHFLKPVIITATLRRFH